MTEVEFLERYRAEKKMFEAYGGLVSEKLTEAIVSTLKVNPDNYFKVPLSFRLKGEDSIIQKAFYRNKNYKDPYLEITDKVGGRIVVLLEDQANDVCKIIESLSEFTFSKDRDFEAERDQNPEIFNYKSHHYILRNKRELILSETIPENTPIEIQIRTLLQHAYSELTHDTIYKPNTVAAPEIKRQVAKSMALIEVTDQIFSQVASSLMQSDLLFSGIINDGINLLSHEIALHTDINLCNFILDAYIGEVTIYNFNNIKKFATEYKYVFSRIKERSLSNYLFQQPITPFLYFLVSTKRKIAKAKWPLQSRDLEVIFVDLGISFDSA